MKLLFRQEYLKNWCISLQKSKQVQWNLWFDKNVWKVDWGTKARNNYNDFFYFRKKYRKTLWLTKAMKTITMKWCVRSIVCEVVGENRPRKKKQTYVMEIVLPLELLENYWVLKKKTNKTINMSFCTRKNDRTNVWF